MQSTSIAMEKSSDRFCHDSLYAQNDKPNRKCNQNLRTRPTGPYKRMHQSVPLNELRGKKTDSSFAAHHGIANVVKDRFTGNKISGRVTDAISTLLKLLTNFISVWPVVAGTTREEHVVDQVFSETFVTVKRMKLPSGVQPDSQTVDDDADRQQDGQNTEH